MKAAKKDFEHFPKAVRDDALSALTIAAEGGKADIAKPMKGVESGVFEIVLKHHGDTYRTVYALKLADAIWVIHVFQKKSKKGIKTPQKEINLIRDRLKRLKTRLKT